MNLLLLDEVSKLISYLDRSLSKMDSSILIAGRSGNHFFFLCLNFYNFFI